MFSTLRTRFGIPGVISVMALVFAMFGGAYAASNSSGGGKATASAKAKKGPRGPKGATGPAGPAGPAGLQGPAGAKGDAGSAGANGAAGASVTSTKLNPGNVKCPEGGTEFKVGSDAPTYACNGEEGVAGEDGKNGEPWTAGGTLPPGATETGAYSLVSETGEGAVLGLSLAVTSISFSIPLAAPLDENHVKFVPDSTTAPDECENTTPGHPGTASVLNPEADPGYLCVYGGTVTPNVNNAAMEIMGPSVFGAPGADVSGALLMQEITDPEAFGNGTWAVTAGP